MTEHFNFLLFENFYRAVNHNKDVDIIAGFLKKLGYCVAIVDVCPINNYVFNKEIPIIKTVHQFHPFKSKKWYLPERIYNVVDDIKWNWHLHMVMKEMKGKFDNLYVGSYYTKMLPIWFYDIPRTANVYFWGLRSFWLQEYKYSFSLRGINSYFLYRMVRKYDNIRFFVSDENIKKEFVKKGVASHRLVLRYERFVMELPSFAPVKNQVCTLLSIGSLRADKRIERIVSALTRIQQPYKYIVAGKADEDYDKVIEAAIKDKEEIVRVNHRLNETEFNDIFDSCNYLILCDRQPPSCVTNGTMNEALLKGKPIIAPNYEPYKSVIDNYHVGFLFNPEQEGSLESAIEKALQTDVMDFEDSLREYQKTLLYDVVLSAFKADLEISLKTNH